MRFWDAKRASLVNGMPTWQGASHIALPAVHLTPVKNSPYYSCEVMVNGSWSEVVIRLDEVGGLLKDWEECPELALVKWFRVDAPREEYQLDDSPPDQFKKTESDLSAEDLGL